MDSLIKKTGVAAALIAAAMLSPSQGEIHIAGELTADMRGYLLDAESSIWTNQDTDGDTLGSFNANSGNVNVTNLAGHLALAVEGNGDHALESRTAPTSMLGNHDATVEAWLYVPAPFQADNTVLGYGSNDSSGQHARCYRYAAAGSYNSGMFSAWYQDKKWDEDSDLIATNWVYVAWVVSADGGIVKGYVNGVQESIATLSPTLDTQSSTVSIGSRNGGSGSDPFRGYIADLRIHTGALPDEYVYSNYVEGVVTEFTTYTTNIADKGTPPSISTMDDQNVFVGNDVLIAPVVQGTAPLFLQWYKGDTLLNGATNASLELSHVQVEDSGVYCLTAMNYYGDSEVSNSMTLSVVPVPDCGPRTIQFDVSSYADSQYAGTAIAPGKGTIWNQLLRNSEPASYLFSPIVDSYGNSLTGLSIRILNESVSYGYHDTNGDPTPLGLMKDFLKDGPYVLQITGLPAGEYDLYVYSADGDPSSTTVDVDAANGGDSARISTSAGGDYRSIYTTLNSPCYTVVTGCVATAGGNLTFTNSDFLCGFQLQSALPVVEAMDNVYGYAGEDAILAPGVTGRSPMAYQWYKDEFPLVDATNATLSLSAVDVSAAGDYTLVANNELGAATNSLELTVLTVTGPVTINLDVNNGTGGAYSGTAIASGNGTVWNQLSDVNGVVGPHVISSVVDAQGNEIAGCTITVSKDDGGGTRSWGNNSYGSPNPVDLMQDYLFNGPYTVTVSGLDAGEYDLYAYAHNDQAGPSTVTVAVTNGSATASTTDTGDYRDLYQTNVVAEGNSYLRLEGSVSSQGGSFTFQVNPYLEGFQLQSARTKVVLDDQTVTAGESIELVAGVEGRGPFSYDWSADGVAIPGAVSATLVLENVQSAQNGTVYSVSVWSDYDLDLTEGSMTLTVEDPEPQIGPAVSMLLPSDSMVSLAWPTNSGAAFNVLTNANLINTNGWGDAGLVPFVDGDTYKVTNNIGEEAHLFFKLESF